MFRKLVVLWGILALLVVSVPAQVFADTPTPFITRDYITQFKNRLAAGQYHSVALKGDKKVIMWGDNSNGQQNLSSTDNNNIIAIDSSYHFTLGLKADGKVIAWGSNSNGQCNVPSDLSGVKAVSAGYFFSLALKNDGTIRGWGQNNYGQCNAPAGLTNVVEISAGGSHSMALKNDGTVVVWGDNLYGQCDVPAGLNNVISVAAGLNFSLALKSDGTVVAWGSNTTGQCNVPVGLGNVIEISGANNHAVALKSDGSLVAWGANDSSIVVPKGYDFVAITAGGLHTLALKADGSVVAWGWNNYGQCNVPGGLNLLESPPETVELKVDYSSGSTQSPTNTIYPRVKITNTGTAAVNLSDVKLRYYYTVDGDKAQNFYCDYATAGSTNVTGTFVKISNTSADYYLEIGFNSGAGSLAAGASTEVQTRFNKVDWYNYTQTNDYSYLASTSFVPQNKITAYHDGSLIWGIAPDTTNNPTIYLVHSTYLANAGQIIETKVKVRDVYGLAGYQVSIKYDKSAFVPYIDETRPMGKRSVPKSGDILINDNFTPFRIANHDLTNGFLDFSGYYVDILKYKASGISETAGTFAVIYFKVLKNGVNPFDSIYFQNPTSTTPKEHIGDVNGDKAVNMTDIVTISKSFNTAPGYPNYKIEYDLNKDGAVNIKDVVIIASGYNTISNSLNGTCLYNWNAEQL